MVLALAASKSVTNSLGDPVSASKRPTTAGAPQPDGSAAKLPEALAAANTKFTYKIIDAPNDTYGYDVFGDGRLMIHQTSVPALPGNEGLKTKEDATKVALLVIEKIKKGEMPPTVSIDEMKTLRVIK